MGRSQLKLIKSNFFLCANEDFNWEECLISTFRVQTASCFPERFFFTLCVVYKPVVVNDSTATSCPPIGKPIPATSFTSSSGASVPASSQQSVGTSCSCMRQGSLFLPFLIKEMKFDEKMAFLGFGRTHSQDCLKGDWICFMTSSSLIQVTIFLCLRETRLFLQGKLKELLFGVFVGHC